jgi:hypothetical protein
MSFSYISRLVTFYEDDVSPFPLRLSYMKVFGCTCPGWVDNLDLVLEGGGDLEYVVDLPLAQVPVHPPLHTGGQQ